MLVGTGGLRVKYIIGLIIFLLVMIVTGYFIKRKYYKEMDRLESWKLEITDRPVLDEMSKVKQLNMTGQTEELFERWRNQWDDIVTVKLPNLEELLFDAEEYIDRYRFGKAKENQKQIENRLQEIEEEIKRILNELNGLVGSEEKNRVEIEQLKDSYREAKKNLLAHHHSFGKAEKYLEAQLKEVTAKFQEYEEKTQAGNYLEARETVLHTKAQLESISKHIEVIPQYLIECQSILPSQLMDIREGFHEMVKQGYNLEHIQLMDEISDLEEKINACLTCVEEVNTVKAEEEMKEVKSQMEVLFDLLEKEVHAKHFVMQNEKITNDLVNAIREENNQLNYELQEIQQSYHLTENDFEKQLQLENKLSSLYKRYEILREKIKNNDTAQSVVGEELTEIKGQLDDVREEQQTFFFRLQALRKDEIEARDKIQELSKKVSEAIREISKSNLPGLSEEYKYLLQDGTESIENVRKKLEEKPLDISSVNQYLEIAVLTVEKLIGATFEMIENATLAEKVIQYGNRYRSHYPTISKALDEAEKAFRSFDYHSALEQAATSIQAIDPGAIKRIEKIVSKEEEEILS
jgi:septation ring formation regulator